MGDALTSLSIKDLKQLENRLERGIARIRSKKVKMIDIQSKSKENGNLRSFHNRQED
jgi:hypothetical protein